MITTEELVEKSSLHLYLRNILFLVVSSAIPASLIGSLILLLSFILQGIKLDMMLLAAAFTLTFSVYNFDRLIKQREDLINDLDRSNFIKEKREIWATVTTASLITSIALGAVKGLSVLLTMLLPLAVFVGYGIGIPSMPRLKDIPGVKNLVLAGTWAFVPTLLPNLIRAEPLREKDTVLSLLFFYFIFTKVFINTILFDVRDIEGDRAVGVKTLPVVLGVKRTRMILLLFNATLLLWIILCWHLNLFLSYLPILAANMSYGFWYIHYFTRNLNRKRILADLFVDGEWIPLTLLITLVYLL